jgi:hypothetical protein
MISLSPRTKTSGFPSDSSQLPHSECNTNISPSFTGSGTVQTSHTFAESFFHPVATHLPTSEKWIVSGPFTDSSGLLQMLPAAGQTSGQRAWIWALFASLLLLFAGC